ncbi:MAG: CHAD domain-containing protein, partial [Acinetobacter sp.]
MQEIELKLQIPTQQQAAIAKTFNKKNSKSIDLHARYFDTNDNLLAKHLTALRIRKEGQHWIQTLKSASESHLQRFEHEIDLGSAENVPELNLAAYLDIPQAKYILNHALGQSWDGLILQFETIVQRKFRLIDINNSQIELCLDRGLLRSQHDEAIIHEVEFELKHGSIRDLIFLTHDWVQRYGIWLDVRSKAERGNLLAQGKKVSPATTSQSVKLNSKISPDQALRTIVANCLEQILPNVAAIADHIAEDSHIHQARVGIRRLRSALKSFKAWSTEVDPHWQAQLREIFSELGASRDESIVFQDILPKIPNDVVTWQHQPLNTGIPKVLSDILQDSFSNQLWLSLLNFAYAPSVESKSKIKLQTQANQILKRLYKKILQDANQYSQLHIEQQHQFRKDLKQLRYSIEFLSSLYPKNTVRDFLSNIEPLQDALGQFNDVIVAQRVLQVHTEQTPQLWFAVGWLHA